MIRLQGSKGLAAAAAASALSGALVALSYPGLGLDLDLDLLVWVGWLPLWAALEGQSPRRAFWLGWLAGGVFFLIILSWLLTLGDWIGGLIVPAYLLLAGLMALSWGLWAGACAWLAPRLGHVLLALVGPALWVGLEYLRASGPFGFTWGGVGYALYRQEALIQWAEWTGVWGLSFLVLWTNGMFYYGWKARRLWPFLAVGLALLILWVGGERQRRAVDQRTQDAPLLKVALIQPNVTQKEKTDPYKLDELLDRYRALLEETDTSDVELVALPESILPTLLLEDEPRRRVFEAFARERGVYVLLGSFTARAADGQELYNSVLLLTPQGEWAARYDKVQLVPFSTEYFPLIRTLRRWGLERRLGPLALGLGALSRGEGFTPLGGPGVMEMVIGTPICFESSFPQIARRFVLGGAQLLMVITNDAWFKESAELEQHYAMGVLRAVENRRAFVQVANTGQSGAVAPDGTEVLRVPPHRAGVFYAAVPLASERRQTLYTRWGDWLPGLCLLISLGGLAVGAALRRGRRATAKGTGRIRLV